MYIIMVQPNTSIFLESYNAEDVDDNVLGKNLKSYVFFVSCKFALNEREFVISFSVCDIVVQIRKESCVHSWMA